MYHYFQIGEMYHYFQIGEMDLGKFFPPRLLELDFYSGFRYFLIIAYFYESQILYLYNYMKTKL